MLRDSKDIKEGQEYWYSCVYFKHALGQIAKTVREIKPRRVKIKVIGNYLQINDINTGTTLTHPSYSSININWTGTEMYFTNFIFETEQEAWDSYKLAIQKEIDRTEELCEKRLTVYKSMLKS